MEHSLDMTWEDHQQWESGWWGDCTNTFGEETKQLTYAHRMGLEIVPDLGRWPVYDLSGKSIIDLGGGPVSMLLKTRGGFRMTVVDPCEYPAWVADRYSVRGIEYVVCPAEEFHAPRWFDECWIYNVLQHVQDPQSVIATAKRTAARLRIFEWINTGVSPGHPQVTTAEDLTEWLGEGGHVENMNENGCYGQAFYGEFSL